MNIRFFLNWVKKIGVSTSFILSIVVADGQSVQQAIDFSDQDLPGDSRIKSLGGASATLGGVATMSTNPATSVLTGKSQFVFAPNILTRKSTVDFLDQQTVEPNGTMKIASMGLVIHSNSVADAVSENIGEEDGVSEPVEGTSKPMTFGFAYNRTNNYTYNYKFEGINSESSITDYFGEEAARLGLRNQVVNLPSIYSPAELAFLTYLVDPDSSGVYSIGAGAGGDVHQELSYDSKGGLSSLDFSYAVGLSDKLSIGVSGGFTIYNLKIEERFTEEDREDVHDYYNSSVYIQRFEASGAGAKLKLGGIFKPSKNLTIGAYYHLPSGMTVNRRNKLILRGNFTDHPELNEDTLIFGSGITEERISETFDLEASYKLKNPGRSSLGVTYERPKIGLVTADVECINHSAVRYENLTTRDLNVNYGEINDALDQFWKLNFNLKVGGELRLKSLRFRAGTAIYNLLPTNNDLPEISNNLRRNYLTFGFGIEKTTFFLDLAYVKQFMEFGFTTYNLNDTSHLGSRKVNGTDVVISLGLKF